MAGMIIDDAGILHGDWPLISINADQDIKSSNWRDKNDVNVACMHVYKCVYRVDWVCHVSQGIINVLTR